MATTKANLLSHLVDKVVPVGITTPGLAPALPNDPNKFLNGSGNWTVPPANSVTAVPADLTFINTGNRITGDFSNATVANRVMFQTSAVNTYTVVSTIPSGAGTFSATEVCNSADPANCSVGYLAANAAIEVSLNSARRGSGAFLPLTFYTGGSEKMRIDAAGNVGIGGVPSRKLHVINYGTAPQAGIARISGNSTVGAITNTAILELEITAGGGASIIQSITNQYTVNGYEFTFTFYDSAVWRDIATNTERLKITASGNVLVSSPAGLGYGTGAGGTVTQATSRNTAVAAINKPTGAITLVSAAGSATPFTFTVPNSLVVPNDVITLSVRSGTNRYIVFVSSIAAGSFDITGYALSGTATEAPIINFAVIKGASI